MEKYELTNPQKSIWVTEEFYKGTSIENIAGSTTINEKVDFNKLKDAINIFIKKAESFRLKFTNENNKILQYISDYEEQKFETVNVNSEQDVKDLENEFASTPFEIFNSLMFRFKLFKFEDGHGGFIVAGHHLLVDAWACGIVISTILEIYSLLLDNKEFDKPIYSYLDYIQSEQDYLSSKKFETDKEYWAKTFETIPEIATIPGNINNATTSSEAKRKTFNISDKKMNLINEYCKSNKISPFNFFMGIYALYLSRVSNLDEFVIGTPILNRSNIKDKHTVGMFISVVPVKISINHEEEFKNFVSRISSDFFNIFKHQKYPYQILLENLRKNNSNMPNLFNMVISYQNMRTETKNSSINYETSWAFNGNISDDIDIHFFDINNTGSIDVAYDYRTSKYSSDDIYNTHSRILHIINQILENNDILLKDVEIVTPEEKDEILYKFNHTQMDYPKDKTIVELFEEQVQKHPNDIAVVFEDQKLTYKELNEKANSLANTMIKNNITKGDTVGIILNRSLDMIVAIWAVLKAGCIYTLIDTSFPAARKNYILNNCEAKFLIYNNLTNLDEIKIESIKYINIDSFNYVLGIDNPSLINSPSDDFAIIYTSGSTGNPKGVLLHNKGFVNTVYASKDILELNGVQKILGFAAITFDMFALEVFASILLGKTLYLLNDEEVKDPIQTSNIIIKNNIDFLVCTPTKLELLISNENIAKCLKPLKSILLGGEVFKKELYNKMRNLTDARIYNGYGPTEITAYCSCKHINVEDNINIGKPLPNMKVYVLDKNLNLCPVNVPGELCVAGIGVSHGYIYDESRTLKSFVHSKNNNELIYKTGDLGYFTPNGEIVYLGRSDNQVKIRGLRIELSEIEENILKLSDILSCVVVKKDDGCSHEFLCAYYTSKTGELDAKTIRKHLQENLPQYMIPQYFIYLNSLPYTQNGKIDIRSLPTPKINNENKEITLPRNAIDAKLIDMLKELLNLDSISIDDNFFEIGGDSLCAINLCAKIYSEFHIQIFVKDILENGIIKSISDFIYSKRENDNFNLGLVKVNKMDYYPTTYAQKRIYYASKVISGANTIYNTSGALLVDKLLDINKIKEAFSKMLELHSSLRTQFVLNNDELVQEITDVNDLDIEIFYNEEKNIKEIVDNFPKPFDLSNAPLLRVSVCILDNKKTLILIDTHHIIIDGTSMNILIRDFCNLYNNQEVAKPNFEYVDYSIWERKFINGNEIKEYEKYWSSVFANKEIPVLNLPYDYPSTNSKTYNGDKISCKLEKFQFEKFQNLARFLNVSEYTLFLSALYLLLYKYTSQTDLIVASPYANRIFEDTSNIVGMFVNNILLRQSIDTNSSISDFLRTVQSSVTNCLNNQPYPSELITKQLHNSQSLFDVVLTYQNTKMDKYEIDNSNLEIIGANTKASRFNLWFEIVPQTLTINLEYNTDLFKKETINSFLEHYMFILNQIAENSNITINGLNIITKNELKLLEKFNNTSGPITDDTVVSIFEEQVKKHPDDIALICEDKSLTYKELNEKSNSLAHYLIQNGIGANDIVCIMTNRSFETIVCMMAILKAGAAFFNVDPTYPIERTKYYIEDSRTRYVLTQRELKNNVDSIENCIIIDLDIKEIYNNNFENPNVKIGMQDLSYLIYTSGSTGKPKGTMLNHVGFANMVKAMTLVLDYLKEGNKHCIASVTSTPFDIFVYEIIVSLTHGLKIAMATNAEHRNPKLLDRLIKRCNVDVMTVTPSLMKINYDNREPNSALANVKNMVFGGEPLPEKFVKDLRALADDITIYNIYGPSEITILSNVQNLDNEKEITVGPPILNTQIHILDANMQRVPIGVAGEIYISGIQVGLGYIGKPDLTNEKFIDNPFGEGKMYKSGDIGKWTFDGKVQILGRIDHQIKLRGLRIELGEIENVLLNIDGVSSAVVNKIELDNKEYLCAYYVCDGEVQESLIKNILHKKLPQYMVPTYFVKLKEMPYTINRKIDRKALPIPGTKKNDYNLQVNIEQLNTNEEKLVHIWKSILKTDSISINDNLFDIGGDSIAAITIQIEALKYGLDFEYSDIFMYPTIKELCEKIDKSGEDSIKTYDYTKLQNVLDRNTVKSLKSIKKVKINNILLIGSTGYLGAHILDSFMKNNKGNIYCLVRQKDGINIEKRLKELLNFYFGEKYNSEFSKRIHTIKGDIVDENLGLSTKDYDFLSNNIDVVINSGALVKHFGIKKTFEKINVQGTKNIIDFCTKNNKRLIHISTTSISGNDDQNSVLSNSNKSSDNKNLKETDIFVGQNLTGVYSISKFKAELLVLEAITNGLDAQILRLGNIVNRYSDGVFQKNSDENAFANRLKAFIKIGAFPKYLLDHSIELTPVDLASEAIIKILNHSSKCNVLHIYNTKLIPIKSFTQILSNILNIDLLAVPNTMMKDIITGILCDNSRKELLSGIIYDLDKDKNLIYTSNIQLNAEFSEKYLKKIGFTWKELDEKYILKLINGGFYGKF